MPDDHSQTQTRHPEVLSVCINGGQVVLRLHVFVHGVAGMQDVSAGRVLSFAKAVDHLVVRLRRRPAAERVPGVDIADNAQLPIGVSDLTGAAG